VSRTTGAAALVAALLAAPTTARAHEVLHEVERGRAIAMKAYFADGEPLAYASYEVFSPADPKIPYQKGRTDRSGYLAFVPDAPGKWRLKVIDGTGHGLDLGVDVESPSAPEPGALGGGAAASAPSGIAFVLRPLVGLVVIGAVFAALVALYRRKGMTR
jgi:nickel transport protein